MTQSRSRAASRRPPPFPSQPLRIPTFSTAEEGVNAMKQKAAALGMTNTVFTNASGLHDKRQVSSARDMARLAQVVIDRKSVV